MRTPRLLILAGTSAPLILSSVASADFIGLKTVKKDIPKQFQDLVAMVVNLYATFSDDDGDGIGDGLIFSVAGIPGAEGNVNVRDGVFYQNPFGGDTAPNHYYAGMFPSLALDTFVTIGAKTDPWGGGQGGANHTALTPGWPGFGPARLLLGDGAWFVTPDDAQAYPGQADNPPNQVLIGQFSVAAGAGPNMGVFGTLLIRGLNANGSIFQAYLSFENQLPAPSAIAVLGSAALLGCRRRRRDPEVG